MGIRGLTTYVLALPGQKRQQLRPETLVLIDGHGWAYTLWNRTSASLGAYAALDTLARNELEAFRASKLRIVVFFDGPSRNHKRAASWRRQKQTSENWEALRSSLMDGASAAKLPSPPLLVEQLRGTLLASGVDVRECESEADFDLCDEALKNEDSVIFANDSDFFAVRGVRYAPLSLVRTDTREGVSAVIWTRRDLADVMGLPEAALVEIALLLGNDFTGQYNATDYDNLSENAVKALATPDRVEPLRLVALEEDWGAAFQVRPKCSASFAKHYAALFFARTFYANHRGSIMAQLEDNSLAESAPSIKLPRTDELLDVKGWIPSESASPENVPELVEFLRKTGPVDLGELALQWLELLMRKRYRKMARISDACTSALYDVVRYQYRVHSLQPEAESSFCWEDVRLSVVFQRVCCNLYSWIRKKSTVRDVADQLLRLSFQDESEFAGTSATEDAELVDLVSYKLPFEVFDGLSFAKRASALREAYSEEKKVENPTSDLVGAGQTSAFDVGAYQYDISTEAETSSAQLPIAVHKDRILQHVLRNRVTIIRGETGCGKSSKIPHYFLSDWEALVEHQSQHNGGRASGSGGGRASPTKARLFVSQPRRIAARGLCDYARRTWPEAQEDPLVVGCRMGQGVRDEAPRGGTRVWYCTSGYLVRLLANNDRALSSHTHFVIDEVHERSIDTDLLLMLTKRFLVTCPHLRVVIMSATINSQIYYDYFREFMVDSSVPQSTVPLGASDLFQVDDVSLFVGARRCPVDTYFAEDIACMQKIGFTFRGKAEAITRSPAPVQSNADVYLRGPNRTFVDMQQSLVVALVRMEAALFGTRAILVFVSGMNMILDLTAEFEELTYGTQSAIDESGLSSSTGIAYECFPIHSDIPCEDQMKAFDIIEQVGRCKVILATNAAESSVTIPDVDAVIDLGLRKEVVYSLRTGRANLVESWISKASAIQRAGRTGRVRAGRVYHLYSQEFYNEFLDHDAAEIQRKPLDEVIVYLKALTDSEPVKPLLNKLIEPPQESAFQAAMTALHQAQMLTSEEDEKALLTRLGQFANCLPVGLTTAKVLALGAVLGVFFEAAVICSISSLDMSIFKKANRLVAKDANAWNKLSATSFIEKTRFDGGMCSDVLGGINVLRAYQAAPDKRQFCSLHSLSLNRMRQFALSFQSIIRASKRFVPAARGYSEDASQRETYESTPVTPELRLDILRFILVLTHSDQLFSADVFVHEEDKEYHKVKLQCLGPSSGNAPRQVPGMTIPGMTVRMASADQTAPPNPPLQRAHVQRLLPSSPGYVVENHHHVQYMSKHYSFEEIAEELESTDDEAVRLALRQEGNVLSRFVSTALVYRVDFIAVILQRNVLNESGMIAVLCRAADPLKLNLIETLRKPSIVEHASGYEFLLSSWSSSKARDARITINTGAPKQKKGVQYRDLAARYSARSSFVFTLTHHNASIVSKLREFSTEDLEKIVGNLPNLGFVRQELGSHQVIKTPRMESPEEIEFLCGPRPVVWQAPVASRVIALLGTGNSKENKRLKDRGMSPKGGLVATFSVLHGTKEAYNFGVELPRLRWRYLLQKNISAIAANESVIACFVPDVVAEGHDSPLEAGKFTLYAVATSLLFTGTHVVASNITVLPKGLTWINSVLAVCVMLLDPNNLDDDLSDDDSTEEDERNRKVLDVRQLQKKLGLAADVHDDQDSCFGDVYDYGAFSAFDFDSDLPGSFGERFYSELKMATTNVSGLVYEPSERCIGAASDFFERIRSNEAPGCPSLWDPIGRPRSPQLYPNPTETDSSPDKDST